MAFCKRKRFSTQHTRLLSMTILIFTPTDNGPHPDCLASVSQLTYKDVHHEVSWLTDPLPGRDMRNVVRQYQKAWKMALEGGYDALLTVEHDMIIPPDTIEKLVDTDSPVVYGVYMLRHGTKTLNAWRYENNRNMGMSLSLYPKEVAKARKQGWIEVCGVGWGCTLIRRQVLEKISVRENVQDAGDVGFASDCIRRGFRQIARFDTLCGHIEPDGNVLWPFAKGNGMIARVLALQDVTVRANGQSLVMKKGRYYSLPVDEGRELARVGYVQIANDETAVDNREVATDPKPTKRSKR